MRFTDWRNANELCRHHISKGRSTVAVMRPFGEVVISPFEVRHTDSELSELARQLKSLGGETRVVMEATGTTMRR